MATTIHFVYPVLVILGCVIFYREAISRLKVVCVVLCTAGILLLYTPGGGVSLLGIALSFLSGVTYAFYAVYLSKSGLQKMGAFQLMFWLNLARHGLHRPLHRSQRHIYHRYPALRLGGGGTLWHTLRYGRSAVPIRGKIYRRTKTSLFSTFEPLTSVLIGITVYKEAMTPRVVCGLVSILVAVVLLAAVKEKQNASICE